MPDSLVCLSISAMNLTEVVQSALALPEAERLELARRLIESIAAEEQMNELLQRGVRRIEDVIQGKVTPLSEEEFRAALQ